MLLHCLSDKVLLVLYLLVSFRNAFVMTQRLRCPGRLILVNRVTSYDSDCQQSPIRTQVIRRDRLVCPKTPRFRMLFCLKLKSFYSCGSCPSNFSQKLL